MISKPKQEKKANEKGDTSWNSPPVGLEPTPFRINRCARAAFERALECEEYFVTAAEL
jgi:hypothetical protein